MKFGQLICRQYRMIMLILMMLSAPAFANESARLGIYYALSDHGSSVYHVANAIFNNLEVKVAGNDSEKTYSLIIDEKLDSQQQLQAESKPHATQILNSNAANSDQAPLSLTKLNDQSDKFKLNVVTDNMIDSLNSLTQMQGKGEIPVDAFHKKIAAAVNTHPEFRAIYEQTKVAGFASSEAFAAYLPQVSATSNLGSLLYRSGTASTIQPKGDGVDAALNLRQLIYDFGATSANYDAIKFRELAVKERFATKRSELGFRSISAYFELLRARMLYKLANDNYASRLEILNMLKERYELGGGSKVDVIRAEARLTDAKSTHINAEISLQNAQASYIEMFSDLPEAMPMPQDVAIDLANLSLDDLSSRFGSVREAKIGLKGFQAEAQAAESRMLPTINFEMTGARRDLGTFYGSFYEANANLVLRYNLFVGGQELARKEQALHRAEQVNNDLDNLVLQVKRSIAQSNAQVNEAENLLRARRDGVLSASESLLAVKEHFSYRRGTLLDLLRSQEELYIAGRDYISSMVDRSISRYRLLHLTAILETMIPEVQN